MAVRVRLVRGVRRKLLRLVERPMETIIAVAAVVLTSVILLAAAAVLAPRDNPP